MYRCECRTRDDVRYRGDGSNFRQVGKRWEGGASPSLGRSERATWSQMQFDPTKLCHYCKGRGHWKAECPVKYSAQSGFGSAHAKPDTLAASVRKMSSPCGLEQIAA